MLSRSFFFSYGKGGVFKIVVKEIEETQLFKESKIKGEQQ